MSHRVIPIEQLEPGMYVTELDIPWIKSPFMLHNRRIKSEADIIALKKAGVANLTIDPNKGKSPPESAPDSNSSAIKDSPEENESRSTKDEHDSGINTPHTTTEPQVSLNKELGAAKKIRQIVLNTIHDTFENIRTGDTIDTETLTPVIQSTIESLERNDQAMITLLHLQRKAESLLDHTFGTLSLSLALAHYLKCDKQDIETLGLAAMFHDSGWTKLPLNLFTKRQCYSRQEQLLADQHLNLSLSSLAKMSAIPEALPILIQYTHHMDKAPQPTSAPAAQVNGDLNQLGHILAVADRYDQLIHGLMDSPGVTPQGALKMLYKQASETNCANDVVSALIHLLSLYPIGSAVLLDSGEKAVVSELNRNQPKEPKVAIYYDKAGNAILTPLIVDLAKQDSLHQRRQIIEALDTRASGVDPAKLLHLDADIS
jgi:HD-GYP domain-containing protein (c-di-GMP phosphodiesterase class II)